MNRLMMAEWQDNLKEQSGIKCVQVSPSLRSNEWIFQSLRASKRPLGIPTVV